jgi:hypothetical protein
LHKCLRIIFVVSYGKIYGAYYNEDPLSILINDIIILFFKR